jgi:hypothetical protein
MRRMRVLGAVVLAAAMTLAGCASAGEEPPAEVASEEEQSTPNEDSDAEIDADLWPLTGLPRGGGDASLPVLSAKIDNAPLARPQWVSTAPTSSLRNWLSLESPVT